ncbi:MAG: hypothetical protein R3F59_34320 [Myxococcota bacterium]
MAERADASPIAFCSPFDAALAANGAPAVFLRDVEGLLRFDAEWTRDAWGRAEGAPQPGPPRWALARDGDSGYVQLVMATSPDLLQRHPRLAFRTFDDAAAALDALAALGRPPMAPQPW